MPDLRATAKESLQSIAEIFFVKNWIGGIAPWAALVVLYPLQGLTGTAALLGATVLHELFRARLEPRVRPWIALNAFLFGLGFAHYYGIPTDADLIIRFISLLFVQQIVYYALMPVLGGKFQLPLLTLPFVVIVRVMLAVWPHATTPPQTGMGESLALFVDSLLPSSIALFLRSLGALFFVRDAVVGACIAVAILSYSRILFSIVVMAFVPVLLVSGLIPAGVRLEIIGFNAMVTAMMIGAVYEVPSRWSYKNAALFTALCIMLTVGGVLWSAPVLNLPFILAIYAYILAKPLLAAEKALPFDFTPGTPEQNLYYAHNRRERYAGVPIAPFTLPFNGEWMVTQSHDGEFTHKDAWKHAWDFERADAMGNFSTGHAPHLTAFFSYKQPVCAAMEGEVTNIQNYIPDNEPGNFNFRQNWGNTVVVRHPNGLYSAYSHLTVIPETTSVGKWLQRGEVIGYCGNSGRSERPHLHFQFQNTAKIGDTTVRVPIKRYLVRTEKGFRLHIADTPRAGDRIANIESSPRVLAAFSYPYGKEITATGEVGGQSVTEKWISTVDFLNHTYLYCEQTGATAFFFAEEGVFYFTDFFGPKHSLLGLFALAAGRIVFTSQHGVMYEDQLPLNRIGGGATNALVDMLSPIARVRELRAEYAVAEEADRTITFRNRITDINKFPAHREHEVASFDCALPYGVHIVRVTGALNGVSCSFTVSY